MIAATLLVIPDLVLEEHPLRKSWHAVAMAGDWLIWLIFLAELVAVVVLAEDWRAWLRRYPLAPAMIVLTPPFAPAALQTVRALRLLRLLRVARGFQLLSKLLTLQGLKYVMGIAGILVVAGGLAFANVESRVGHPVSSWDGIWWAMGVVTTEGSHIEATTNAGRAIAIVLMLAGIGVFSVMTGAVAQRFLASRDAPPQPTVGEQAILARLDQLAARLHAIEARAASSRSPHPPE